MKKTGDERADDHQEQNNRNCANRLSRHFASGAARARAGAIATATDEAIASIFVRDHAEMSAYKPLDGTSTKEVPLIQKIPGFHQAILRTVSDGVSF